MRDDWPLPAKRKYPPVNPDLTPAVSDRDPAEPVVFYSLFESPHRGAAARGFVDDRGVTSTNSRPSSAAVIAMSFEVPVRRVVRSRRTPRAEWRLAMRKGRSPVRTDVGELRRDQSRLRAPSPGRLVTMSPCRAMAPPAQLVAPLSADALGTAA
jgi:hypothetical protein